MKGEEQMQVDLIGACYPIQWFLTQVILLLRGHLAKSVDMRRECAVGILVIEARGTAKHPLLTRQPPTTKNYPAPNGSSDKTEKPCSVQLSYQDSMNSLVTE